MNSNALPMSLKGKTILITGGAIRVGAFLTRYLAERGAQIILHYRQSQVQADALLRDIPGSGHLGIAHDFTKKIPESFYAQVQSADVLINNASVYHLEDGSNEDAIFNRINHEVPCQLIKRMSHGCVINFLDAEIPLRGQQSTPYDRSKQALSQSTLALAKALAPNVRVNGLALGPVLPPTHLPHADMSKFKARLPLKKTIPPEDICKAVEFLILQETITGQILYLDSGLHLLN